MAIRVKKCRICNSLDIRQFLDLGPMPLPNGFIHQDDLSKKEPLYPLSVGICVNCSLMQLVDVVNPHIMFRNYVYIPSASSTRIDNFRNIVRELLSIYPCSKTGRVFDIGSNDGSLLLEFKKRGLQVLGIDPAENLAKVAELKGVSTINDYFSSKNALKIKKQLGPMQFITATNVVAHIHQLHDFFKGISALLDKQGIFLCEFPYVVDLLEKYLFDTIYQEHLSYFSVKSLDKIIDQHGLKIIKIRRTAIDGGALRLVIAKKQSTYLTDYEELDKLINLEKKVNLDKFSTYKKFASQVSRLKRKIKKILQQIKKDGKSIAGYGAAARGNILMNYCGIGSTEIDFIVDSTPYKQGLYTPGNKIRIFPEEEIMKRKPDYVLILAWNFAREIMNKQRKYKALGGKFIIPVPHVKII